MRRATAPTAAALTAAAALSLLAGCSDDVGGRAAQAVSDPSDTAAASTSARPAKTAAPGGTSSSTAAGSSSAGGGAGVNQRGNIPKALGEEAGITDGAGGDLLTFTVAAITPDLPCDSGFDDPPLSGHYVGIELRVSTSPSLTADDYVSFSEYDFAFIGPDGVTDTSVDGNAWTCLSDDRRFPSDTLGPGQQYVGTIVVDVPATTGTLVFAPSVLAGNGGWEWQF